MQFKPVLTGFLTSTFLLGWNGLALAEVQSKYDAFDDRTTIQLFGEKVRIKPLLHAWHQFDGQKPSNSDSAMVGFFTGRACMDTNFLADGERVQPMPGSKSYPNPAPITIDMGEGHRLVGVYNFNFYKLPEVKQIATAKSVQYKVCDKFYTLSSEDQAELQKFLSYINNK